MRDFALRLIEWQHQEGRHGLPWQVSEPYRVWLSEIMLQQTQVETVVPYYLRFLGRFPTLMDLATASLEDVLALWSGLGYYARARNLHAAARQIAGKHDGRFPDDFTAIQALPGIGRSTAAAIAVFAFGQRRAILDGNVKRVFCRIFGIEGWPGERAVEERLWRLAEELLPERDLVAYTQGLMDLGATLCRRGGPDCERCPFRTDCLARRQGRQAELPAARPRKALPERTTAMLILLHAGEVLLERRAASGIWGGLWSLPECPVESDAVAQARGLGYEAHPLPVLPGLSHTFSHFRLHISPRPMTVTERPLQAGSPGHLWLPLAELETAALPAPVRTLLQRLPY